MLGVDPRRYGSATQSYLKVKNEEAYENVFTAHYPDEERAAARPLRTAPCYDRLKALGAVFGQKFGWGARQLVCPRGGTPQVDHWSFRRSGWFERGQRGPQCPARMPVCWICPLLSKCRISGPECRGFPRLSCRQQASTKGGAGGAVSCADREWRRAFPLPSSVNLPTVSILWLLALHSDWLHDWIQKTRTG